MATRITLGIEGTSQEGMTAILVQETFDEVMEKYWPISPASSSLQGRENAIFTGMNDNRILIKISSILLIEENAVEE